MTREALGPWMKLYADIVERKAHYTDRQFRALITVYCMAQRSPSWGDLPPRSALEAQIGRATVAFLFDQRDLAVTEHNGVTGVTVTGWSEYQARPVDSTNAERQARFRARQRGSNGLSNGVTSSASDSRKEPRARPPARDPLIDEIRGAIVERYGEEEVHQPKDVL